MATSRTKPPKTGTLAQFPQPESNIAVEEPPQENETAQQPAVDPAKPADPAKRGRGRPHKTDEPIETNFFQRVAAVAPGDWGTRVYLYLYQIEPVCDLKQSGGKAYLMRYQEPVRDEHQIMLEQGSGKYRLVLALNKISPANSNELARYEFEIYNPKYPPRIPKAVWVNDPRNRRWEALLPKEEPPVVATAASTIVDAMKMVSDIRRDVRDEIGEPEAPQRTSEVFETMRAAKELFAPSTAATAPTAPADPFDTAKKIMDMRGNDPMIAALMQRLDAADKAAEKARDREFELMKELRQTAAAPAAPPKSFTDQLLDIAALGDKLDPLKKLFGFGAEAAVGRVARTTAYDVVRDIAASPFGANLGQGLGMLLSNLAQSGAQANGATAPRPTMPTMPPVLNAQQSNGTIPPVESPEQRITRIGQQITQPMLYEFFLKDESGETFAERMFDMWPEDYIFMRNLGAENIVARYRQFPPAWAVIQAKEANFVIFINEFCRWDPNEDEGPAPPDNGDPGTVDLEGEGA